MRYSGSMAVLFVTAVVTLGSYSEAETETPRAALDIAVTDVYDAIETPLRFPGCTVDCYLQPYTCPGRCAHKAPYVGYGSHDVLEGSHTSCWPGHCEFSFGPGCMGNHPVCSRGPGLDASLSALDGSDFAELGTILDSGAGIEVLWEPGLLAFYDCVNRVVASVALTGEELAALAVAEGQLQ